MIGLLGLLGALTAVSGLFKGAKSSTMPNLPGPTDAEVLASDLRLRRSMAAQRGRGSTIVSGGLADSTARLTMPSLVGV